MVLTNIISSLLKFIFKAFEGNLQVLYRDFGICMQALKIGTPYGGLEKLGPFGRDSAGTSILGLCCKKV